MSRKLRSHISKKAFAGPAAGAVAAVAIVIGASWVALDGNSSVTLLVATLSVLMAFLTFSLLLIVRLQGAEIDSLAHRIDELLHRDPSTNAMNGTAFAKAVGQYSERRKRIATDSGGIMVSAVFGSYDEVSKRYGPEWAETVMKSLTAIIQSSVRAGDLVARLSMNELGIFLPGAAAENAIDVAQRIRARVAASAAAADGTDLPFNLKLGGTSFDGYAEFNSVRQLASELASEASEDEPIAIAHY